MLSDLNYGFPNPDPKKPAVEDREHLPLADLWENWWQVLAGLNCAIPDGMELLRADAWCDSVFPASVRALGKMAKSLSRGLQKPWCSARFPTMKMENGVGVSGAFCIGCFDFIRRLAATRFALDAAESALALLPKDALYLTDAEAAKLEELKRPPNGCWPRACQPRLATAMQARQDSDSRTKTLWRTQDSPFRHRGSTAAKLTFLTYTPQTWNSCHAFAALAIIAVDG